MRRLCLAYRTRIATLSPKATRSTSAASDVFGSPATASWRALSVLEWTILDALTACLNMTLSPNVMVNGPIVIDASLEIQIMSVTHRP
jgi:hypothetical protein